MAAFAEIDLTTNASPKPAEKAAPPSFVRRPAHPHVLQHDEINLIVLPVLCVLAGAGLAHSAWWLGPEACLGYNSAGRGTFVLMMIYIVVDFFWILAGAGCDAWLAGWHQPSYRCVIGSAFSDDGCLLSAAECSAFGLVTHGPGSAHLRPVAAADDAAAPCRDDLSRLVPAAAPGAHDRLLVHGGAG